MKQRDIIYAIFAAIFLIIAGYLVYGQVAPHKSAAATASQPTVDVVQPLDPTLDTSTIKQLTDITQTQDFVIQLNIATGLGNSTPFGG